MKVDLGEPLQHRQPAGARPVHLCDDLADRRAQPVGIVRAPGPDMQERGQGVPQRAKADGVALQIAA